MAYAYYNEHDAFAAAWLRELIADGQIAPGEVDERDIRDVLPSDLRGFTQCHFFAGIGVWSYALRLAGWPDNKPIWTGSCPCQPFSAAGRGAGTTDERHLWPSFFHLIEARKPLTVVGEQVESAIKHGWLDLVQDDLEGIGYAFGAVSFPAASVGAPHIRQRLYFAGQLDHPTAQRLPLRPSETVSGEETRRQYQRPSHARELAHPDNPRPQGRRLSAERAAELFAGQGSVVGGFWSRADWLYCRDSKFRPVEPGTFPLAHGATNRVGRLRGYGNAIVAPQAAEFVKCILTL